MAVTVQDLRTSRHRDRGSGRLSGTRQEKQRETKIGETPGASHQVQCTHSFAHLTQMMGVDVTMCVTGVKAQPVTNILRQWLRNIDQRKGKMCSRGENLTTSILRRSPHLFSGYPRKVQCLSQQLECGYQNGRTHSGACSVMMRFQF